MIQKDNLFYSQLANFLKKKFSANKENTKYRTGSFDADIQDGEPDIMWQSKVYILSTQQMWTHGSLFGPNSNNTDLNDLAVETGERKAADILINQRIDDLIESEQFVTQDEYDALVDSGMVVEDVTYNIYE